MRRLLLVTRDFPPHRGGGVRRVEAMARLLPSHGFEVEVLASTGDPERRYAGVSKTVRSTLGAVKLGRVYRLATRWLAVPDEAVLDVPSALRAGSGAKADLVLASSPPSSVLAAGYALASKLGVPWVADLRDPWSDHPLLVAPTPLHRSLQRRIEERVLSSASAITAATYEMADALRTRIPGPEVAPIFNGYDPGFFAGEVEPPPVSEGIVVGYYGSFYGAVDPEPLARAAAAAGAVIEHAGADFDARLDASARKHGARVRSLGMVSNAGAVALMRRAHVLALVLPDDPSVSYWRTQKLAEYVASGRPILALVREGEAARVVREHGAGEVVMPADVAGAAAAIRAMAARPTVRGRGAELAWEVQMARLADVLSRV